MSPQLVLLDLIAILKLLTSFFMNGMFWMVPCKSPSMETIRLVGMLLLCSTSVLTLNKKTKNREPKQIQKTEWTSAAPPLSSASARATASSSTSDSMLVDDLLDTTLRPNRMTSSSSPLPSPKS
ncbi:hypothetical protein GUJ93_ZPchr0008g13796 [Zizania palustris]|uniref:Uncharacterized protein n=1 Tax=Zizania palustris TaxID=103762 RepID=A0A8J5VJR3_ZIZPA|nr:hypothetical protein GUJ93_ZPchr0008g13796 [Zizania palustris]